jgi:translocation protein SEC63
VEKASHVVKEKKEPMSPLKKGKWACFGLLWLVLIISLVSAYTSATLDPSEVAPFNPFDILDVSEYATDREIKKAFRKLSLKYHPDKNPDDPQANDKYVEVTRAYRTLTEELARENWKKYGNPDGPQGFSMGIALPSWLVDPDRATLVLVGYMILLSALGATVIWYWRSWREMSPLDISYDSMRVYLYFITEDMRSPKKLLDILSSSQEYATMEVRPGDAAEAKELITEMNRISPDYAPVKTGVYRKELIRFNAVPKCSMLFHAHLTRLHSSMSPDLRADLTAALGDVQRLLNGMVTTLAEGRGVPSKHLTPVLATLLTSQCFAQAVWPNQELLQLPNIDRAWLPDLTKAKLKNKKGTLRGFLELSPSTKKDVLVGTAAQRAKPNTYFLSKEEEEDVEAVLNQLPSNISMVAEVYVDDVDAHIISPGSATMVNVRVRRVPRPAGGPLAAQPTERRQIDDMLQGVHWSDITSHADDAAKEKSDEEIRLAAIQTARERRFGTVKQDIVSTPVHAPYFPGKRVENFFLLLGDTAGSASGGGQLWGVKRFEVPPLTDASKPGESVDLRFTIMAPKKVGRHTFSLWLQSDSYLGLDLKIPVVLDVQEHQNKTPIQHDRFSSEEEEEEEEEEEAAPADTKKDSKKNDDDDVFAE